MGEELECQLRWRIGVMRFAYKAISPVQEWVIVKGNGRKTDEQKSANDWSLTKRIISVVVSLCL